jgi:hypothetical protein
MSNVVDLEIDETSTKLGLLFPMLSKWQCANKLSTLVEKHGAQRAIEKIDAMVLKEIASEPLVSWNAEQFRASDDWERSKRLMYIVIACRLP